MVRMDRRSFTSDMPGDLIEIPGGEVAFLPAPLPRDFQLPVRLWPLVVRARERLALLEGVTQQLVEPALLLRPLQQREALRSSSLEGTYATPKELLLFELDPREKTNDSVVGTWIEVHNYARALQLGASSFPDNGISLHLIRQLHLELMHGVRGRDKDPGSFRTSQVFIGADHRFVPPPPSHLQGCLDELQGYMQADFGPDDLDPLVRCFLVHYQFEAIHPFLDGNGRVGRLLLALMIKEWCGLTRPWLYLSAFFDHHKDEYIDGLFAISARRSWEEWLRFCLRATEVQAADTIERCRKLLALRQSYHDRLKQAGGNVRLVALVDGLFSNAFIRITDARDRLEVSYPTAQSDIDRLVRTNVLREVKASGPRTFYAWEIFDIAFAEPGTTPAAQ